MSCTTCIWNNKRKCGTDYCPFPHCIKKDAESTGVLFGEDEGAAKGMGECAEGVDGGTGTLALQAGKHGLLDAAAVSQLPLVEPLPLPLRNQIVNKGGAAVKQ